MSSEALSEQSCVHEGTGYDMVYPSSQDDPGASYFERVPSANSLSEEEDEESNVDRLESGTDGDLDGKENVESPIRSVIGLDGLSNFVLPLRWTVNDFNSTIKRKHFNTLQERY